MSCNVLCAPMYMSSSDPTTFRIYSNLTQVKIGKKISGHYDMNDCFCTENECTLGN